MGWATSRAPAARARAVSPRRRARTQSVSSRTMLGAASGSPRSAARASAAMLSSCMGSAESKAATQTFASTTSRRYLLRRGERAPRAARPAGAPRPRRPCWTPRSFARFVIGEETSASGWLGSRRSRSASRISLAVGLGGREVVASRPSATHSASQRRAASGGGAAASRCARSPARTSSGTSSLSFFLRSAASTLISTTSSSGNSSVVFTKPAYQKTRKVCDWRRRWARPRCQGSHR